MNGLSNKFAMALQLEPYNLTVVVIAGSSAGAGGSGSTGKKAGYGNECQSITGRRQMAMQFMRHFVQVITAMLCTGFDAR
jgi:hypothetical protein